MEQVLIKRKFNVRVIDYYGCDICTVFVRMRRFLMDLGIINILFIVFFYSYC